MVDTKGKGTQIQSNTDFNVYGNDLANFAKFKGNDKNDAMRMTRSAATDVKKAYMQLQHEFPDVQIAFEPMPNPQTFGKKREGFFNYQQALNDWKDIAMTQIANAREATMAEEFADTRGTVVKGAIATMDTVNARADGLTDQIDQRADRLEEKVENEGKQTRSTVHAEGRKTRGAVHAEGAKTRQAVQEEGVITRNAIRDSERRLHRHINDTAEDLHEHLDTVREEVAEEGQKTRENTDEKTKQTQELASISDNITVNLASAPRLRATTDKVEQLKNSIIGSSLSFNDKKSLLKDLEDATNTSLISNDKLSDIDIRLHHAPNEAQEKEPNVEEQKYPSYEYQIPDEQMPNEPNGKEVPKSGKVNPFDKHVEQNKPLPKGEPSTQPVPKDKPDETKPKEDKPDGGEPAVPPSLQKPENKKLPKPEWQK